MKTLRGIELLDATVLWLLIHWQLKEKGSKTDNQIDHTLEYLPTKSTKYLEQISE